MLNQKKSLNFIDKFPCSDRQKAWIIGTTFEVGELVNIQFKYLYAMMSPFLFLGVPAGNDYATLCFYDLDKVIFVATDAIVHIEGIRHDKATNIN